MRFFVNSGDSLTVWVAPEKEGLYISVSLRSLILLCHKLPVRFDAGCSGMEILTRGGGLWVSTYVEALSGSLGHCDRVVPFRSYCIGLLLPGPRKSVEPMAGRMEPG
jgi:hypothetical protein